MSIRTCIGEATHQVLCSFFDHSLQEDSEVLVHVQRRVSKLEKGLERKFHEECLRELGLFSWERGRLPGPLQLVP